MTVLASALLLANGAFCAEDNVVTIDQLKATAQQYDQAGQYKEAAQIYEQLIQKESAFEQALGHRLIQLYVASEEPQKAVAWARKLMDQTPDPRAFLARVYEQCGSVNEARAMLEHEASVSDDAQRKTRLLWQLSALCEKQGDAVAAEEALAKAAASARDTELAGPATQLLARFNEKLREESARPGD